MNNIDTKKEPILLSTSKEDRYYMFLQHAIYGDPVIPLGVFFVEINIGTIKEYSSSVFNYFLLDEQRALRNNVTDAYINYTREQYINELGITEDELDKNGKAQLDNMKDFRFTDWIQIGFREEDADFQDRKQQYMKWLARMGCVVELDLNLKTA